jgi:putative FmdB family regulatory protein
MPIYEYRCQKCGDFEVTQKITENPLSRCPTCKSKIRRLISNTSFQLKGTGWYITDYGRKDKSTGTETKSTGKASDSNGSGKASSESESKTSKDTSPGSSTN